MTIKCPYCNQDMEPQEEEERLPSAKVHYKIGFMGTVKDLPYPPLVKGDYP